MSKKQERLRSELLSEDKITNLLGFLTKQNPGLWSIYKVKNPSPQIHILKLGLFEFLEAPVVRMLRMRSASLKNLRGL